MEKISLLGANLDTGNMGVGALMWTQPPAAGTSGPMGSSPCRKKKDSTT